MCKSAEQQLDKLDETSASQKNVPTTDISIEPWLDIDTDDDDTAAMQAKTKTKKKRKKKTSTRSSSKLRIDRRGKKNLREREEN